MLQSTAALYLFRSGSILLGTGFVWGTMIPLPPYPRIALSLHLNMIQHGLMSIAAAAILSQKGLVELSDWQIKLVSFAHLYLWVLNFGMLCNCWWGTSKSLPILAKESGATGGKTWQEVMLKLMAFTAATLIPAWGVIAYQLFQ